MIFLHMLHVLLLFGRSAFSLTHNRSGNNAQLQRCQKLTAIVRNFMPPTGRLAAPYADAALPCEMACHVLQ